MRLYVKNTFTIMIFCLLLGSNLSYGSTRVVVKGLFKNAAVLTINGKEVMLRVGKTGPAQVTLLKANARFAVLRVDGERRKVLLGRAIGTRYEKPSAATVVIKKGQGAHYFTPGSINGAPVRFLVDTGASSVSMSTAVAKGLGIDYKKIGISTTAMTAAGETQAWAVRLDSVKVGSIMVRNVNGLVVEGLPANITLLGMSYLKSVKMSESQNTLRLQQKF